MLRFFTLLTLFFAISGLWATNYYVSSSTGDDTNDGLTPATALKTIKYVNYLFDKVVTLQPGDSILFKRGDSFYGNLLHLKFLKGTATFPIVISAYEQGENPCLISNNQEYTWTKLEGSAYDDVYYTDDFGYGNEFLGGTYNKNYFDIKLDGGYNINDETGLINYVNNILTQPSTCGPASYTSRIVVRTHDGNPPTFPDYLFLSTGVLLRWCEYVVIEKLNIQRSIDGISILFGKNNTIQNCNIQELKRFGVNIQSDNINILNNLITKTGSKSILCYLCNNTLIKGNEMSYVGYSPFGFSPGSFDPVARFSYCNNSVIEYNYIHHNQIGYFYDANEDYGDIVRNNYVYNTSGFGAYYGADLHIYNNIFDSGDFQDFSMDGAWLTGPDDIEIYNNVFYLQDPFAYSTGLFCDIADASKGVKYPVEERTGTVSFQNNVMHNASDKAIWLSSYNMTNTISDNNCFSTNGPVQMRAMNTNYYSLPDFAAGTNFDTHSYYGAPEFISGFIDPDNLESYGFATDYPCKEAGIQDLDIMKEYFPQLFNGTVTSNKLAVEASNIKVYPNPGSGIFYISFDEKETENYSVKVLDINSIQVACNVISEPFSIDLHRFPSGIYFLNIYRGNEFYACKKIVKY